LRAGTSAPPSPAREHDQEVLSRLTSTAEKQRATLRHQELQMQEKQQVIDGVSGEILIFYFKLKRVLEADFGN
jgi:hypothetical protein